MLPPKSQHTNMTGINNPMYYPNGILDDIQPSKFIFPDDGSITEPVYIKGTFPPEEQWFVPGSVPIACSGVMPIYTRREMEMRTLLQDWTDKQSHDRCWYYPDIFMALCQLLDVKPSKEPELPPRSEFEKGCCKYQDEEYLNEEQQ